MIISLIFTFVNTVLLINTNTVLTKIYSECGFYVIDENEILTDTNYDINLSSIHRIEKVNNKLYLVGSSVFEFNLDSREVDEIIRVGKGPYEVTGYLTSVIDGSRLYIYDGVQSKLIIYDTHTRQFEKSITINFRNSLFSEILDVRNNDIYFRTLNRGTIFSSGFTDTTKVLRYNTDLESSTHVLSYPDRTILRYGNRQNRFDSVFEVDFLTSTHLIRLDEGLHFLKLNQISNIQNVDSIIYRIREHQFNQDNFQKERNEYEKQILSGNYATPQLILNNFKKALELTDDNNLSGFKKIVSGSSELLITLVGDKSKYLHIHLGQKSERFICGINEDAQPVLIQNGEVYSIYTNPDNFEQSILHFTIN